VTEAETKPPAAPPPQFKIPEESPDEFAHIPGRSRGRSPVLAVAAVLLAVFLAVRLRHDVGYAVSSSSPRELGEARSLAGQPLDALPLNRYVRLGGVPERESAVVLDTHGSWKFAQFFRLRGTGGRVFVRRAPDPLPVALAERDRFTGRLLRFSDLSFSDSIARHFASDVSASHFFRPAELLAVLGGGPPADPLVLSSLDGDRVSLRRDERLHLDVLRPGQYRVELVRDRFPDRARARQSIQGTGAQVLNERETPDRLVLEIAVADAQRDRVLSAVGDLDRSVRLRPARDTVETAPGELSVAGGQLLVRRPSGEPRAIPAALLASVRTRANVTVPPDALLLLEGETPRQSWPSLVVLSFLLAFALVNLLGLRRPA
jgi:hypothetical protein